MSLEWTDLLPVNSQHAVGEIGNQDFQAVV